MNISDEAVEAAAKALATKYGQDDCSSFLDLIKDDVRVSLEAAAPHMLATEKADIWDEGWGAPGYAPNPYRGQA